MSAAPAGSLRAFAEAFFTQFGARIEAQPDELVVDLPPALAAHFDKPRLYLVFPAPAGKRRELSPHEDLLVYGSRTFDLMLALLDGQGETSRLRYPRQVSVTLDAAPGPSLRQPQFRLIEIAADRRQTWYQIFNFRVTYRSDEKAEVFETLVLDETGQPSPEVEARLSQLGPPAPLPEATAALNPQPDRAAALIRQRIDQDAVARQRQSQARLEKVLLRLTGFYRQRLAEIETKNPAQAGQVQQELKRKIADELERHQLHITITPISMAVALLPTADYRLVVSGSRSDQASGPEQMGTPYTGPPPLAAENSTLRWAHYRWQQFKTEDYTIYVGHHWLWGVAVLVLDYAGKVLQRQQLGWFVSSKDSPV